jgi:hypothetical protein
VFPRESFVARVSGYAAAKRRHVLVREGGCEPVAVDLNDVCWMVLPALLAPHAPVGRVIRVCSWRRQAPYRAALFEATVLGYDASCGRATRSPPASTWASMSGRALARRRRRAERPLPRSRGRPVRRRRSC